MLYVYRFRLYPSKEQVRFLNRQIGCCRFTYNKLLEIAKRNYQENGEKWDYYKYKKLLPKLKKEFPFLKEANSQSLQEVVRWLDRAFRSFFKGFAKFPKFKSKKRTNSLLIPQNFHIEGSKVKIPKLRTPIRFKKHREIKGKIKSISITKLPSGKFYLNVLVEREVESLPETDRVVAIDLGLTHFCTLSTGEKIENPKHLLKVEKRLKKLQRKLSRKVKGSNKYLKLQRRVAKLHEKIVNQRNDFLHKLSKRIIGDSQAVIVESLNVKGLMQNGKLSKHVADASWRKFISYLEYKAELYGRKLIKVNPFFPSSKLCSICGYKNKNLKLSIRKWKCPNCGAEHDRDYNAALNLLKEGLKQIKGSLTLRAVGLGRPELTPVESSKLKEAGSFPL
jgi:putative transposase